MLIRDAELSDARGIAKVLVDTWRNAYRDIVPDEHLDNLSYTTAEEKAANRIANASPGVFYLVADSGDGSIIGTTSAGPVRDEDDCSMGEIYSLYVLEQYQRQGIGRALMSAAGQRLHRSGFRSILVWTLGEAASPVFYERMGGRLLKTEPVDIGGRELTHMAFVWDDLARLVEQAAQ